MGRIIPYFMENKTCSKPPTSPVHYFCNFGSYRMFRYPFFSNLRLSFLTQRGLFDFPVANAEHNGHSYWNHAVVQCTCVGLKKTKGHSAGGDFSTRIPLFYKRFIMVYPSRIMVYHGRRNPSRNGRIMVYHGLLADSTMFIMVYHGSCCIIIFP